MTWPRDHKYVRSFQGSTVQTDVTKVTCKVSINGGAATTYSSATTPAVTQAANCAFLFSLAFAALTFADEDVVEFSWFYDGVQQGGGVEVFGLAEVDGAHYTPARGDLLDDLATIGDPWSVVLPGAYTGSEAGALLPAIKAKSDLIGSANATVTSPLASSGLMQLIAGDDYKIADGRQLTFTRDPTWPSLTGATVRLTIDTLVVSSSSVTSTTITFELTAAQTAPLVGNRRYAVIATLSNGDVATLVEGLCSTKLPV